LGELRREKIWDPVTRLWHWVLALVVTTGWCLGKFMTFSTIEWHFYCGYTVLGLIAFRLLWGLVGPQPVRLRTLLPGPRAVLAYVRHLPRRQPSGTPGHNPLGALSVLAMLLLLGAQASSGLFVESDNFFESGPLADQVSEALRDRMSWWHGLLSKGVLGIVAVHVSAIVFYFLWKKENLVGPMLNGWKWVKVSSKDDSAAAPRAGE
jgi:cytochrome b